MIVTFLGFNLEGLKQRQKEESFPLHMGSSYLLNSSFEILWDLALRLQVIKIMSL